MIDPKNFTEPSTLSSIGMILALMAYTLPQVVGEDFKAFWVIGPSEGQVLLFIAAFACFVAGVFLPSRGAQLEPKVQALAKRTDETEAQAHFVSQRAVATEKRVAQTERKVDAVEAAISRNGCPPPPEE